MKYIFIALAIFTDFISQAQDDWKSKGRIGLGFSVTPFGKNDVSHFGYIDGDPTFSNDNFHGYRIYAFYKISKNSRVETGFDQAFHSLLIDYAGDGGAHFFFREDINVVGIPLTMRNTYKFFYFYYGMLVNFEINHNSSSDINKQNGIGMSFGLGSSYHFKPGFSVFAGPDFTMYAAFPGIASDMLMGIGGEFGVSVDF